MHLPLCAKIGHTLMFLGWSGSVLQQPGSTPLPASAGHECDQQPCQARSQGPGPTNAGLLQALDDGVHALSIVGVEAAGPVLHRGGPVLQPGLVQLPLSRHLLLGGHAHLGLQLLHPLKRQG